MLYILYISQVSIKLNSTHDSQNFDFNREHQSFLRFPYLRQLSILSHSFSYPVYFMIKRYFQELIYEG